MSPDEIKAKVDAIIMSEDGQKLYDIYDGGPIGDLHELWQTCVRYRQLIEALEEGLGP